MPPAGVGPVARTARGTPTVVDVATGSAGQRDDVSVLWFRRDLRLDDHPALLAACDASDGRVVPLFVVDPVLWGPAGAPRRAWLLRSLRALDEQLGGSLVVRSGAPADVVPALAEQLRAGQVHVTADTGPYGRRRDEVVATALTGQDRRLVPTGTPYAIGPGTVLNGSAQPYQVFTPFSRAWARLGWPAPAPRPDEVRWVTAPGKDWPEEPDLGAVTLPEAGEAAARARWATFAEDSLPGYADRRNIPGVDGTSGLSAHLKYGEIHPRTVLADLQRLHAEATTAEARAGIEAFRDEICWREFYADVLWHAPGSARDYLREQLGRLRHDDPGPGFTAWTEGRTGFPFVDAGMRQLLAEGWIHNRVRMVVASFLVKDLHVEWQHGARHFMRHLRDGDLASNSHGWQWVAGSGTDASPYYRVFNPVTQGEKFDPDGAYVRRHVPELAHLPDKRAHRPWDAEDGYDSGYPHRIVDHAEERLEALARLAKVSD